MDTLEGADRWERQEAIKRLRSYLYQLSDMEEVACATKPGFETHASGFSIHRPSTSRFASLKSAEEGLRTLFSRF